MIKRCFVFFSRRKRERKKIKRNFSKCKNTSNEEIVATYSSFESSRSSEFDQNEFESLITRDERLDYLLAVREKVRGLKMREVKYFCLKFLQLSAVAGFFTTLKGERITGSR